MTGPQFVAGSRVTHFTILGRLGAGGMGVVYRARDEQLRRDVALKVLPAATAADPNARARLLREARSAAALNHPSICTVHEVGTDAGRDFIAMELVEGSSLHQIQGAAGFTTEGAIRVGIAVADAFAHAHKHGVIHRDLKSANVMMTTDGRIKVMDFGLARVVARPDSATQTVENENLTRAGAIVGTTHYLPPEVLHGGEAGAAGDLWALGVLLHELVAGEMPFDGGTSFEVASAILHSPPRALPASVPDGLRAVIMRLLEKEPTLRYHGAGEVRAALELIQSGVLSPAPAPVQGQRPNGARVKPSRPIPVRLLAGLGLVAAIVLAWLVIPPRLPRAAGGCSGAIVPEVIRALAVMPLENLSRDPEQAYFADGMTEEISTRLAKIAALRVIAQGSVVGLVKSNKSVPEIGRLLKVPAVLRGSVARQADRVAIRVQLVRAESGQVLWAESYERSLVDVLTLQSEVALAIAHEIQVQLTPQEKVRLEAAGPVDPEAYQEYLKGRSVWGQYTLESFQQAERHFRRSIELAPGYAPAWAGLADAAYGLSSMFLPPNTAIPRARAAAVKALELDESLAEAHTSMGIVKLVYDWDWRGAEAEFDRAIGLKPGDSNAHLWRGHLLVLEGRFDDGLAAIRRALDLDPLSSWVSLNVGWHLYFARRYDEAIRHLTAVAQSDPGNYNVHVFLGLALEQSGDHSGAVAALERAVTLYRNNDDLGQLAHAYGTAGRRADALRIIAEMRDRRTKMFLPAADLAYAFAGIAERDSAFHWFDLAVEDHSELLILMKADPALDPIRSDPRFDAVLRRVNLLH